MFGQSVPACHGDTEINIKATLMNNERFLQPLIERLLSLVGLQQTLAYVSTYKEYRKERKWFIEQQTIVEHEVVKKFTGGISIKHQSATAESVDQLETFPPTLTRLTFYALLNRSLENVTLAPTLTHLTFGHHFNQLLDNVTHRWPLDCLSTQVTVIRK